MPVHLEDQLAQLLRDYGLIILKEPRRFQALLLDTARNAHQAEVHVLSQCVERGIPVQIQQMEQQQHHDLIINRLVQQLKDDMWLDEKRAYAVIELWSRILLNKSSTVQTDANSTLEFEPYKEERGEEYMNERQEAHFRTVLTVLRQELMEEVDCTIHHMRDGASNFPDPNDRATQESEFSLELRARDRERKLIKKIGQAIDRLADHDYGWCESCGVEIGVRRLEARPTATLCIDCKTLQEIKETQMA